MHRNMPASASGALGLKACATTNWLISITTDIKMFSFYAYKWFKIYLDSNLCLFGSIYDSLNPDLEKSNDYFRTYIV